MGGCPAIITIYKHGSILAGTCPTINPLTTSRRFSAAAIPMPSGI
jgi:hypothetical protein